MAAYIQLLSRETGLAESFSDIDEKMCKDFGVEVHARCYFMNWYDMICFRLALGQTYEEIRKQWLEVNEACEYDRELEILDWLEKRYEPKSWFGR